MKELKLKRTREYLEEKISKLEAEIIKLNNTIQSLQQDNGHQTLPKTAYISGSYTTSNQQQQPVYTISFPTLYGNCSMQGTTASNVTNCIVHRTFINN